MVLLEAQQLHPERRILLEREEEEQLYLVVVKKTRASGNVFGESTSRLDIPLPHRVESMVCVSIFDVHQMFLINIWPGRRVALKENKKRFLEAPLCSASPNWSPLKIFGAREREKEGVQLCQRPAEEPETTGFPRALLCLARRPPRRRRKDVG